MTNLHEKRIEPATGGGAYDRASRPGVTNISPPFTAVDPDEHNAHNVSPDSNLSRSVRVAERLALPTSDHRVAGSNPAGGEILPEPKRRFIAQSLTCSPFHRLEMTEILLKGRKTLTHTSNLSIIVPLATK